MMLRARRRPWQDDRAGTTRVSLSIDDDAVARIELFDGKLTLITTATDLTAADSVVRDKDITDIKRGLPVHLRQRHARKRNCDKGRAFDQAHTVQDGHRLIHPIQSGPVALGGHRGPRCRV